MHKIPFLGKKFLPLVLDFTQGACPAYTLKSSWVLEVRGEHVAKGLPCSDPPKLGRQRRTPGVSDGGEVCPLGWVGPPKGGASSLVAALFVQRAAGCVTLCIHCWHRGTRRSGWCWPTPRSGGSLVSLLERQCIHQGYLLFQ